MSDISWLMRLIAEPLARRANFEDQASGRFWQGRFRSVKLCDEAALLACAAYVDLNPMRAGLAASIQASDHTSVQRRIESIGEPADCPTRRDAWLAPLQLDERADALSGSLPNAHGGLRASDLGFLPLSLSDYLDLLEWTCRQTKLTEPDRANLTADCPPILARLGITADAWLPLATRFGRLFQRVAGAPRSVARLSQRRRFRCRQAPLLGPI